MTACRKVPLQVHFFGKFGIAFCQSNLSTYICHQQLRVESAARDSLAWGGTPYNMHMCEILVDRKFIAHFVRS
jgi:hypothetical protein